MPRRVLPILCLMALAHAGFYIWYQRPDWNTSWTDQVGYERLGAALATTGKFTRYPNAPDFVPEVIRTPGYPAFVAAVYLVAGVGNHMAVAVAQAGIFAALVLLVYLLARRTAGRPAPHKGVPYNERAGLVAAGATALFSPFPYFGALVVTELWTAFVATAAVLLCLRAVQTHKLADFVWAGVLFSAATLVRPVFVLLPFFLAVGVPLVARRALAPSAVEGLAPRAIAGWGALAVAAVITLAPWFAYNYINLGDFTLSPAGGIGRGLWEGAWQGRWSGRLQADLITLADSPASRETLDESVRAKAEAAGLSAEPMLQYVHEWRDIRAIWDTPTDPAERARARVDADGEYLRAALAHIRADPVGHVWRRMTRGLFVLWAAEVPIRYSDINPTPTLVIRLIWLAQVLLLALAAAGAWRLVRAGRNVEAAVLTLPLVYVTLVHLPLLCEARQSLPVKPLVLTLAAVAITPTRPTRPTSLTRPTSPGT